MKIKQRQIQRLSPLIFICSIFLLRQVASQQCVLGCKTCNSSSQCIQCLENYSLIADRGQCNYNLCEEKLHYQVKSNKVDDSIKNCQAICDQGFSKSSITNLCEPLFICSQSYQYNPPINIDENIKQLIDNKNDFFIVIYSGKVNLINKEKGRLEISLAFDSNTLNVQYFQGQFFQFKEDNILSKWSINDSGTESYYNKSGQFSSLTKLIKLNSDFLYLYVEDPSSSSIYLRKIYNISTNSIQVSESLLQINLDLGDQTIIFESYLFITNGKGIKIKSFIETATVNINNYTSSFLCSDFWQFGINQIIHSFENNGFYIISEQAKIVALIQQNSCLQWVQLEEKPKYITSVNLKTYKLVVINLQTNVSIFDSKQTPIQILSSNNNNLIDSILINLNNDSPLLVSLFDKNIILFYKFNSIIGKFEQIYQFDLLISFVPTKISMIQIQKDQEQIQFFQILVYKSEIYSLNVALTENGVTIIDQHYITSFARKNEDIQNTIASIDYNIDNDLISICSKSGKIITWDSSQIMNSKIFDVVTYGNYGLCKNLKYISDDQILILFENLIINLNIQSQKIIYQWPIQNKSTISKYITKQGDYLMLIYDSCIYIYNLLNEKIAENCSTVLNDNIYSAFFEQSSNNIVIQKLTSVYVYQFDPIQKLITQKSFYQLQNNNKIQFMKVRTFSQEYKIEKNILFEISIFIDNLSFIIFDDLLKILYPFYNIPLSSVLDIKYVDLDSYDKFYFVFGLSIYKSANFKYQLYAIAKGEDKIYLSTLISTGIFLTNFTKKTNNLNNLLVDYDFKICQQLIPFICQAFSWNISKTEAILRDLQIYQNLVYNSFIVSKNYQYYIVGDTSGQVGINYNKQQFDICVFQTTNNEFNSKDYIIDVQQSLELGKYFVIKSNIIIFNLFTNEFIEKVDIFVSTLPIQKFQILKDQQSFISLKNNIIILKNYKQNEILYTYKKMDIINNFLIIEDKVYIFGSQVSIVDFSLTEIISIPKYTNNQAQTCYQIPNYLLCRMASGYIFQYSLNTLEFKKQIFSKNLDNTFLVTIDLDKQFIFLYTSTIEVYSFFGNLVQIIKQSNGKINQVAVFQDIIAYRTNTFLTIIERASFVQRGIIQSAGGGIISKMVFLKEYYHIVFFTSNTRFGQLFSYSLQTLQNVLSFKNGYTQNEPSLVIDTGFDKEQNFLIYLDQTGNFQQIFYGESFLQYGLFKLQDYSTNTISVPTGFSVDYNTNILFIYTQNQVYHTAYGELNNAITMVKISRDFMFTEIKNDSDIIGEDDLEEVSFIIVGDNGILYKYYNTYLEYYYHFGQQVLQIYYKEATKDLIVALQTKIVIFKKITYDSIQSQSGWKEKKEEIDLLGNKFVQFLCQDVFLTRDFTIFHYDFQNKAELYRFQLDSNYRITSFIYSNTSNLLIIGQNNGNLIVYKLNDKKEILYDLIQKNSNAIIKGYSISYIAETKSEIWSCFSSKKGIYKIKNSQIQEVLLFDNVKKFIQISDIKVGLFQVDEIYSRFFLSFVTENIIRVYDFKNSAELSLSYLLLPKRQHNRINFSDQLVIFYSSSQVMIYNRQTLKFINKIRRQNNFIQINSISVIMNKYIIICSDTKYEFFSLPNLSSKDIQDVKFLDQLDLNDPIIMKYQISELSNSIENNPNNLKLQVIALSKQKVIEQRYNLANEETGIENKKCGIEVQVKSYLQMLQSIQTIKPQTYADPTIRLMLTYPYSSQNFNWMIILESGSLQQVNFKGTNNSIVSIYSSSNTESQQAQIHDLFIYPDTFLNYVKEQINIRDYSFKFQFNEGNIVFSNVTKIINIHNIIIQQQQLTNISFQFKNMTRIVIKIIQFTSLALNNIENTPFFLFENCDEVYIYDLLIENKLDKLIFQNFIVSKNVKKFVIKTIRISNAYIDKLFVFQFSNLVSLNNIIIKLSQKPAALQKLDAESISQYLFQFVGIFSTIIDTFQIQDCQDLQFIYSKKDYINSETFIKLLADTLEIKNLIVQNNKLSINSPHLMLLQNALINLKQINYYKNQGNIKIQNSLNIKISDGEFELNKSFNGGALEFTNCIDEININNTIFNNNSANASGGAIYIEEFYGQIIIDNKKSKIKNNLALIGGGIRITNLKSDIPNSFWENIKNIFTNNQAEIYGNNFSSFLNRIKISYQFQQDSNSEDDEKETITPNFEYKNDSQLTQFELQQYTGVVSLNNFRSGGQVKLGLALTDSEGQSINFSQSKVDNREYPDLIISEIKSLNFKVEYQDQSNIFINGQNIITYKEYEQEQRMFLFKELHVTSMPISKQNLQILYTLSPQIILRNPILFQIQFRECVIGEELKEISTVVYSCYLCPIRSFSLSDPTQDTFWKKNVLKQNVSDNSVDKIECQKCPDSALLCYRDQVQLKNGYWRSSNYSTDIIECDQKLNLCLPEDPESRYGCKVGYIGPTCRECDYIGKVWDNKRYSRTFSNDSSCDECSSTEYQVIFIIITIVLVCYFILSSILFMNTFMHSAICQYLRYLKLLPILRNSIKDYSGMYLKILINYIQISSVCISLSSKFFPEVITFLPNFVSTPGNKIIVSIDCVISQSLIEKYGHIHIVQIVQALIPLFFCVLTLILIKIFEKFKKFTIKKYHKYTLLNVLFLFFQPDQISFFSKQLTCTRIGEKEYISSDLTIECGDKNYTTISNIIAIPILLFWSFLPILILYRLRQKSKSTDTCITRYTFGYFYSDFKPKFYYWEFIRILIRVVVVLLTTLLSQQQFIAQQVIVLILFIYIKLSIKMNPFICDNLAQFDILCYLVIILNSSLEQIKSFTSFNTSGIVYILHYIFIIYILLIITFYKINNPLTLIGRYTRKILEHTLPKLIFKRLKLNINVKMQTYKHWKFIQKNIKEIIRFKACFNLSKVQQSNIVYSQVQQNMISSQIYSNQKLLNAKQISKEESSPQGNYNFEISQQSTQNQKNIKKQEQFDNINEQNGETLTKNIVFSQENQIQEQINKLDNSSEFLDIQVEEQNIQINSQLEINIQSPNTAKSKQLNSIFESQFKNKEDLDSRRVLKYSNINN